MDFFLNNNFKIIDDGEWSWINKNKRSNLINSLIKIDRNFLLDNITNMFRSNTSYGIISSTFKDILNYNIKINKLIVSLNSK